MLFSSFQKYHKAVCEGCRPTDVIFVQSTRGTVYPKASRAFKKNFEKLWEDPPLEIRPVTINHETKKEKFVEASVAYEFVIFNNNNNNNNNNKFHLTCVQHWSIANLRFFSFEDRVVVNGEINISQTNDCWQYGVEVLNLLKILSERGKISFSFIKKVIFSSNKYQLWADIPWTRSQYFRGKLELLRTWPASLKYTRIQIRLTHLCLNT